MKEGDANIAKSPIGVIPMPSDFLSNSPSSRPIARKLQARARLADEAAELFPSGITHDVRHLKPYGIFVERAKGARKWDVDGNEYIDHVGGHGAMILGHSHPAVVAAVTEALANGTHHGANPPREVRWGELIRELVPSAERVRFTASGTEATLMALRLARAFTGRKKVIRFKTHFHGWHDHFTRRRRRSFRRHGARRRVGWNRAGHRATAAVGHRRRSRLPG